MLSRPGWIGSAGGAGAWPYVCKRLSFCGTPNLIPFSHSLYNVQQNLRRVRVPSPRSPVMTKPPVCLLTHPFSALAVLHPDEPCSCFFFRSAFWPRSYAYPSVTPPIGLDIGITFTVGSQMRSSLVTRRCSHSVQNVACCCACCLCFTEIYHGLSCSLSV